MYTEHTQVRAAVRFASPARAARTTVEVRFHCAAIARTYCFIVCSDLNDLHAEFMAQNARVLEEGLIAPVRVEVGPANTDPAYPDQRFAGTGFAGRCRVGQDELTRLLENKRLHCLWSVYMVGSACGEPGS